MGMEMVVVVNGGGGGGGGEWSWWWWWWWWFATMSEAVEWQAAKELAQRKAAR